MKALEKQNKPRPQNTLSETFQARHALPFLNVAGEPQRNLEPEPSHLEACEIHDGLNEDGIITYV